MALRQDLPQLVPRAGYRCYAHGELREAPHFNDTPCCDAVYTVKDLLEAGYTLVPPALEAPEAAPASAPRDRPSALAERSQG